MKPGNITVQPIVEMMHPFILPHGVLAQATPEAIAAHRHWLEPWSLCPGTGKFIITVQSRLVQMAHFPGTSRGYVERAGNAFEFRFREE